MRFLYDQNLSYRLVADLQDLYPNSLHVRDIGMKESDDSDIWDYAAQNGYIIVSKDSDFRQQSFMCGNASVLSVGEFHLAQFALYEFVAIAIVRHRQQLVSGHLYHPPIPQLLHLPFRQSQDAA